MSIPLQFAVVVAQVVPVFYAIAVFSPFQFRKDVEHPRRLAAGMTRFRKVALYVMAFLLAFSLLVIALDRPLEGVFAVLYGALVLAGVVLMLAPAGVRIHEMEEEVAMLPETREATTELIVRPRTLRDWVSQFPGPRRRNAGSSGTMRCR